MEEEHKFALLLTVTDAEALSVYTTHSVLRMRKGVKALKKQPTGLGSFCPNKNVTYERFSFKVRTQRENSRVCRRHKI